jgi:hypothetical protein
MNSYPLEKNLLKCQKIQYVNYVKEFLKKFKKNNLTTENQRAQRHKAPPPIPSKLGGESTEGRRQAHATTGRSQRIEVTEDFRETQSNNKLMETDPEG